MFFAVKVNHLIWNSQIVNKWRLQVKKDGKWVTLYLSTVSYRVYVIVMGVLVLN